MISSRVGVARLVFPLIATSSLRVYANQAPHLRGPDSFIRNSLADAPELYHLLPRSRVFRLDRPVQTYEGEVELSSMTRGFVDKDAQRKIIIESATDLFLKYGFAGTTMEQVAEAAGVVKQTVYNHFPSKEWLFRAIIENVSGSLRAMLPSEPSPSAGFHECLLTFSKHFLRLMLQPRSLGLYRILISEAPRFPELAKVVFMTGANQTTRRLAGYLGDHAKANGVDIADPQLAAEQFIGLLRGNIQLRALLMVRPAPTETQLDRAAEAAVSHFIRAYRTSPSA